MFPRPGTTACFVTSMVSAVEQKFVLIGRSYLTFLRHSCTPELGESDVRLRLHGTLDVDVDY